MTIETCYSYFRSSTAYRLRIALNIKGVEPEQTLFVNLKDGEQHSDDYKKVNPAGAVPAIILQSGEVLTQSMALLEWLEEEYPPPSFLPADSVMRAKVRAFAHVVASDMHPINNLRVLQYLKGSFSFSQAEVEEWMHHWMHKGFAVLEHMLVSERMGYAFCYGEGPSMADICLIPQVYNALRFGVDMSSYPALMQVNEYASRHHAFVEAAPENQPDCNL